MLITCLWTFFYMMISFCYLLHSFTPSSLFLHSFLPSFLPSFIHSAEQSGVYNRAARAQPSKSKRVHRRANSACTAEAPPYERSHGSLQISWSPSPPEKAISCLKSLRPCKGVPSSALEDRDLTWHLKTARKIVTPRQVIEWVSDPVHQHRNRSDPGSNGRDGVRPPSVPRQPGPWTLRSAPRLGGVRSRGGGDLGCETPCFSVTWPEKKPSKGQRPVTSALAGRASVGCRSDVGRLCVGGENPMPHNPRENWQCWLNSSKHGFLQVRWSSPS